MEEEALRKRSTGGLPRLRVEDSVVGQNRIIMVNSETIKNKIK